jgi:two-component system, NtrC family, sensor kinase
MSDAKSTSANGKLPNPAPGREVAARPPFPIYILPFAVLVLALAGVYAGGLAGLCLAGLAALCAFAGMHWLYGRMRQAAVEMCLIDAQLVQSQKLAAIGEIASGIAHEINNPLAIIGQEADMLRELLGASDAQKNLALYPDISDSLREIFSQVARCGDITHKLLGLARKMDPVFQQADVHKIIEDMAVLVEKEAKLKGVGIVRHYDPNLPPVFTDPPLLRQVVLNLLTNAMQAMAEAGQGTIGVTTAAENGDVVTISVTDTGPGIAKEFLPRIFDPFFTTKSPGKGTGLGLSLCQRIVDRLGGRIDAASPPGHGAIFTVRLPAKTHKQGEAQ